MSVIEWLLDSDPSIRWQVMRDLIGESDAAVARARSRVVAEGWGLACWTFKEKYSTSRIVSAMSDLRLLPSSGSVEDDSLQGEGSLRNLPRWVNFKQI